MYLRESKQRRADGSTVSYLQLAENVWAPERRRSETHVVYNCGRADDPAVVERLRGVVAAPGYRQGDPDTGAIPPPGL